MEFSYTDGVGGSRIFAEDRPSLGVDAAYVDSLTHAFEGHTEKKDPGDFYVYREVDENLAQSCNARFVMRVTQRVFAFGLCVSAIV